MVLIGKAMGNGFPVSGVMLDDKYTIEPSMFPSSTFAGNPLASAVVSETLKALQSLPMTKLTAFIQKTVVSTLGDLDKYGVTLRGTGAIWVLEFPSGERAQQAAANLLEKDIFVTATQNIIRLLPPATIPKEKLIIACEVIRDECING
jgi:acetylornithine/succinyldiaminopimelate/putrescine aminotransferase